MSQEQVNLLEKLLSQFGSFPGVEVPPKVFVDMDAEVLHFAENESLTIRFPVKEKYQNPFGHMQGGMIVTAIDNVLGPLAFMVGKPSVTTQLSTQYVRPVLSTDPYIDITATLVTKTKNQIILRAEAKNMKGKLVAIAQATQQVV